MRGMKSEGAHGGENKQQALATYQPSHSQVHTHTFWWDGMKGNIASIHSLLTFI